MRLTFWVDVPDPLDMDDVKRYPLFARTDPVHVGPSGDERRFKFDVDFPVRLITDAEVVAATAPEEVKP